MNSPQASQYSAGTRDTVLHMLERAVATAGDKVFLDVGGDTLTFREADRRATRFAHELARHGVRQGDTVVSICETHTDLITIWFGVQKLGAIWVPINLAYRHEFLRHQICDTGARIVITDAPYLERVVELADELPNVELVMARGTEGDLPSSRLTIERFEDHAGTDETPIPIPVLPQDLACLLYTSGTTGPSKGCMISHNYMAMQGRQQIRALDPLPEDVVFCPLPMFHSAAINAVLGAMTNYHRVALWPRFSLSHFWGDIERSGATHAVLMASIFALVAKAPDSEAMERCKGQLKMIVGVPITPEVRQIWKDRFGVKLVSSWAYGQTENSRLTMALPTDNPPELCAGRAADEFEVCIFDENDCPVPPGTVGQIVCRPKFPNVMFEGYWNRPDATAAVWRNLWMHTGDLGRMDENGWIYFADRAKDYLRSRGENISSFEVEATFLRHPWVAEAAVHAVGEQSGEDEIKVTIVAREGIECCPRELCLWSIENLPYFAVPRFIEFRSQLPKNPLGRVLKYRLRDEGVTEHTWDREAEGLSVRRPERAKQPA
ncbi:AMP-binding protein [Novosphingobium sp. KCTC 2891]|uniref:AMP-binding protein n=1 Tax=Novosphingobium sp. KCTC 2891 TaxID=2989730 RepID=UPI0022213D18|nr:AMP-binding protein [Novosphingobium sp. KCTC 2891]MCW1384876.1 AMP-binding protein [Novosphingobium sp. KCTC 2891]